MDEFLVALVGCGRIAERGYAPAFRRARGVRLAAVADADLTRCALVAPGVPAYESVGELAESARVEALVVATPVAWHLAHATAAAEAGMPVLVEKPPAPDAVSAQALARLEPRPWLGFNRRFEPELERLRAVIPRTGTLQLGLRFHMRRSGWGALSGHDAVLLDLGPHLVDLCSWLTGAEVAGVSASLQGERATVRLELEGGRGQAVMELAGDRPYREHVEVRGPRGFVAAYRAGGVRRRLALKLRGGEHHLVPSLARQLEAFAAAVRGGEARELASAEDGIGVMATLDAARRSADDGRGWQQVG